MAFTLSEMQAASIDGVGDMWAGQRTMGVGVTIGGLNRSGKTDLAKTYAGEGGLFEINFKAAPGLSSIIEGMIKGAGMLVGRLLQWEIWTDTEFLLVGSYKVKVWFSGPAAEGGSGPHGMLASEIIPVQVGRGGANPGVGILPIIAGAAILAIFAVLGIIGLLVWTLVKVVWGTIQKIVKWGPWVIIGGVAVLGLAMLTRGRSSG